MAQATISITVNGEAKEVEATTTGVELFAEDKNIVAVKLNGENRDLYTPLADGDTVEPITLDSEDGLAIMRHSATHVMAQAVQEVYPNAKLGVGPVIKDGFYYDFQVDKPFTPEDLKDIEKRMQRIIKSSQSFRRRSVTEEEALKEEADQPFKIELIEDKEAHLDPAAATEISEKELSFYDNVDRDGNVVWKDLCRGPHLPNTRYIKAFKIERSAAAYWRGSEKNPTMQRIYGTAWANKEDLKAYQTRLEEAAKRDHRKLGAEMDLFSFPDEIGPGLAVFHPKGAAVINAMEDYSREMHRKHHYSFVQTPHITKGGLYETSGHLHWYKDGMYPPMHLDEEYDEDGNVTKPGSVGIPMLNTVVSIFEPGTETELPIGERGEICICTPTVMKGYYNKPEETDMILRRHADGQIWAHTGDVGYMDEDGFVYLDSRIKRMIIRHDGFKVFPSMIENVISRHPAVHQCSVVGCTDKDHVQGRLPFVYVVLDPEGDKKKRQIVRELRQLCNEELPEYVQPVGYKFISEMPFTPVGKVDYRKLEEEITPRDY